MTTPVLDALGAACHVRPAGPGDAVAGVIPAYVACPADVPEASEVMRVAAGRGLAVVPRGAGTKLHWGVAPDRCDLLVDTRRLTRVVEHVAGDLVVKAEAGLTLGALGDVLAARGQRLALDPPTPGATVGGTIATATAGPRRFMYGSARDLLIGITVVRADGVVARSGGKVVKNVAGYDLGKLFAGSYGTLGLIVEATFRLHPLPGAAAYVSAVADGPARALEMTQALLHSTLAPAAIDVDGPDPIMVTALIEGVPDGVAPRAEAARDLIGGRVEPAPPDWWGRLPGTGPAAGPATGEEHVRSGQGAKVLIETRAVPTALAGVLADVEAVPGTSIRGSAGRGVWHVACPAGEAADVVKRLRRHGTAVVLAAPPGVTLDRWGPLPALPLMRRVKDQFDPGHRLSPGRFVGGI